LDKKILPLIITRGDNDAFDSQALFCRSPDKPAGLINIALFAANTNQE